MLLLEMCLTSFMGDSGDNPYFYAHNHYTGRRFRMSYLPIQQLLKTAQIGTTVTVKGWVRTKRESKNAVFIALNDGSTINNIQVSSRSRSTSRRNRSSSSQPVPVWPLRVSWSNRRERVRPSK